MTDKLISVYFTEPQIDLIIAIIESSANKIEIHSYKERLLKFAEGLKRCKKESGYK
jgi:hypothetical protein